MKRIKYEVKLNDGTICETWGYLPKTKGLVITREIRYGEPQDDWVVTHKESSLAVAKHFKTKKEAIAFANDLDGVLDWEKSAAELDNSENSRTIGKIYNHYKQQPSGMVINP